MTSARGIQGVRAYHDCERLLARACSGKVWSPNGTERHPLCPSMGTIRPEQLRNKIKESGTSAAPAGELHLLPVAISMVTNSTSDPWPRPRHFWQVCSLQRFLKTRGWFVPPPYVLYPVSMR